MYKAVPKKRRDVDPITAIYHLQQPHRPRNCHEIAMHVPLHIVNIVIMAHTGRAYSGGFRGSELAPP